MTKLNSFMKQFESILKGDDAGIQSAKAWRQCESALKVQISSLEGDLVVFEDDVTNAKEAIRVAALNNGQPISNRSVYIQNLISAKNNLTICEKKLRDHNAQLSFLKETYENLKEEV